MYNDGDKIDKIPLLISIKSELVLILSHTILKSIPPPLRQAKVSYLPIKIVIKIPISM